MKCPVAVGHLLARNNELVKFICSAKFSPEFWKGKEVSHYRTQYESYQRAYKNRIKNFLSRPRIAPPGLEDDLLSGILQLPDSGTEPKKDDLSVSPYFDAALIAAYTTLNETVIGIKTFNSKESCEALLNGAPDDGSASGSDASVGCDDAIGRGKDVSSGGEDASGGGEDASGSGKDASSGGEDASDGGEDVSGGGKDASGDGDGGGGGRRAAAAASVNIYDFNTSKH